MSISQVMHQHHVHCDDLFVIAENASLDKNWGAAQAAVADFVKEIEKHFKAEEERLFPAFEQATGMSSGPTSVMRMEHGQMRTLFDQMAAAVAGEDLDAFSGAAETLLLLMQQHNMKEENILYPMCEQALPAAEIADDLSQRLT
jgi:hemerythrin-like domain-containing protein